MHRVESACMSLIKVAFQSKHDGSVQSAFAKHIFKLFLVEGPKLLNKNVNILLIIIILLYSADFYYNHIIFGFDESKHLAL